MSQSSTLLQTDTSSVPRTAGGNAALAARSAEHLSPVLARYFQRAWVRGEGHRLWDADGKEYLDFACGLAVTILGHAHPRVSAAIHAQVDQLLHMCNGLGYLEPVTAARGRARGDLPADARLGLLRQLRRGGHRGRRQAGPAGDGSPGHHRLLGRLPRPHVRAAEPDHQQPQLPGGPRSVPARHLHHALPERLPRLRRRRGRSGPGCPGVAQPAALASRCRPRRWRPS